jgi:hypothetical protein
VKPIIICLLALGGIASFSSCVNVTKPEPATTTTTTEETTVSRPIGTTVETQTTQRY